MANIAVTPVSQSGAQALTTRAAAASDTFLNSGREKLIVRTAGTACTVTIPATKACSFGVTNAVHDLVIAMGATEERVIGPLDPERYNNASGQTAVNYSAVTNVTVAVLAA
jgi:hypothetical protein